MLIASAAISGTLLALLIGAIHLSRPKPPKLKLHPEHEHKWNKYL